MSFFKSSVSSNDIRIRGGYIRGSMSAFAIGSVGFIVLSTIFPIELRSIPTIPPLTSAVSTTPVITSTPAETSPSMAFSSTSPTPFLGGEPVTLGGGSVTTENGRAASEIVIGSTLESNISSPSIRTPTVGATSSGALITTNLTSQGGAPTLPGGSRPTLLGESQTNGSVNITGLDVSTARPNTGGFGETTQSIVAPSVNGSIQPPLDQTATGGAASSLNILNNGAFDRNSQLFIDSRSRPLVSIILHVETLEQAAAAAGLAASVTLAVDAENPDAAQIATAYRRLGGETLLSMPLNGNLQLVEDDNAEFVTSKLKALLPEELNVVGIIDVSGASVPDSPEVADSVIRALALSGHAVVTSGMVQPHNALVAANSAGLPATDFAASLIDFEDRNAKMDAMNNVVRGLDRTGSITVYGSADTVTLAALNSWLAGSQAGAVTMAPVSATIKR